jgi:hypothetical protein
MCTGVEIAMIAGGVSSLGLAGATAAGAFTPGQPEPEPFTLPTSDDEDAAANRESERDRQRRRARTLQRTFTNPSSAFVESSNIGTNKLFGQ